MLDIDTYGIPATFEQIRALNMVSQSDLQKATSRLFGGATYASVVVGNSELVKPQLEGYVKVELLGELKPKTESIPASTASKPVGKPD